VMPTLVADKVAPTKRCTTVGLFGSNQSAALHPSPMGTTTPIKATRLEDAPTRTRARRSASNPTSNRRISTPTSARTRRVGSTRTKAIPSTPKKSGSRLPNTMPANNSPNTGG
jgi:hypothetical protein